MRQVLSNIVSAAATLARKTGAALRWFGTALFGQVHWQAPAWSSYVARQSQAGIAWLRANPRAAALRFAIVAVVVVAGVAGYRWYQAQPKPVEVTFTIGEPGRTRIEDEGAKPEPLFVEFSHAVAPLAAVDKEVTAGVDIAPKIEGRWQWEGDRKLRFFPKSDWPIGTEFTVAFERSFFAEQVRLADYKLRFKSAPFVVAITLAEFYQDPVDPTAKKVVANINFSHPVDTADFEKRVVLRLLGQSEGVLGIGAESTPFKLSYDKLKLNAYIHSDALPIPQKDTRLTVQIADGVRAARGGPPTTAKLEKSVAVPGLYSLRVSGMQLALANNERYEPEQVLIVDLSASTHEREMAKNVSAWLLPVYHPDSKPEERKRPYRWYDTSKIGPEILRQADALKLEALPAEREHVETHSFKYQAEPGRYVYVRVNKGVKAFGGYVLGSEYDRIAQVPPFVKEVKLMAQGSLLAMSGEKKLSVLARDVPGLRIQAGRLLPQQIQHLVTQTGGSFSQPQFNYNLDENNLTERFTQVIELPKLAPGKPQYQAVDLAKYLDNDGNNRRGVFLLRVESYDPAKKEASEPSDKRLVVVTDLGVLVKKAIDGTQDVFVQSIHNGDPVAGATIEVLGRNGLPVLTQTTDAGGRARFADLKGFEREKQPVLYLVRKGGDISFLPINRGDRVLDLSRFDVGGVASSADAAKLSAYLFSDRGIYRPGEEFRVGMIVKAADWTKKLGGVPLEVEVTDPRGQTLRLDTIRLSKTGFEELRHTTLDTAPTGTYTVNVYIVKDGQRDNQIGSTTIRVQEFQADRLKMTAHLSSEVADGWVSPENLKARINLQNLFGTPAENRRVTATLTLSPAYPIFPAWRDYTFYDPQRAKEGASEKLAEAKTDEKGEAELDLALQRFARATYRVLVVAQGFEADGGRGVTAEAAQLVSNMPYLVGFKPDGDLDYVSKGAQRAVSVVAIDAQTKKTAADKLTLQFIERKFVSVLTKQDNGTYKYVSKKKEVMVSEKPYAIPAGGTKLALETANPGNYAFVIRDAQAQELARIEYAVAGQANLTRSLEKNAELQLTLNKHDFARGEEIELQVQAPFTGAGLITIERDRVYAHAWFKAKTTATVQKIKLPADFDGNGYVTVTYIRDPASDEIYMSPLSYGVAPVSVSLDARKTKVSVTAPDLVKPGDTVKFRYKTDKPSRIVVFAVDEGILQVARYQTADPLGFFFQKRALEVRTAQILDLILPEFKRVMAMAPGGDAEGALGRHLNPFKRRRDKPIAYWSGLLDAGPQEREVSYTVPDSFNGSLRVMAVAVAEEAVGVFQKKTTVRGDFVLSPNAPLTVTPGDEFEVSVGVSNNVVGSGKDANVALALKTSAHFEVVGPAKVDLKIGELRESVASFRVKAKPMLGSATLAFTATLGNKSGRIATDVSVRPASPYMTALTVGSVKNGSAEVPVSRQMHSEYRKLEAGISYLPLTLAHALTSYLDSYPYLCTEQLTSRAIPALILGDRPEFGQVKSNRGASLASLIGVLRSRQNSDGAFGLWAANAHVDDWAAVYAMHFLIEARERKQVVPADMLAGGNKYLQQLAGSEGGSLADERTRAYAIYLLTRQGIVTSAFASSLQKRLETQYAKEWKQDVAAAYLGAAYQLMKQERLAERATADLKPGAKRSANRWYYARYDDDMTRDAQMVYLLARHFPQRYKALNADVLQSLVKPIQEQHYNTLSSAYTILALDAVASVAGSNYPSKFSLTEILADNKTRALTLSAGLLPRVNFSPDAAKLKFGNDSDFAAYYFANQSGFDLAPPQAEIKKGFEILREYTDASGKPATSIKVGDEIFVHLKTRAVGREGVDSAVLVDLLPGGFDLVLTPAPAVAAKEAATEKSDDEEGDAKADASGREEEQWRPPFGDAKSTWQPEYADAREDRVVLYGAIDNNAREFIYRIKATNAGSFVVPPAYGEGMYERDVQARSLGGKLVVEKK